MMPVHINEIVMRAKVSSEPEATAERPAAGPEERESLVADCVEQVLEILASRRER